MRNWGIHEKELRKYNFNFAVKDNQICSCAKTSCNKCALWDKSQTTCNAARIEWLYQEYKEPVVLTEDEKILCKSFNRGWIARDKDGSLYWYENRPRRKGDQKWLLCDGLHNDLSLRLNKIFPQCKFEFIEWEDEEPWEVKVYECIEPEEKEVDWLKVPIDTPILVSNDNVNWCCRHFAKYENGHIYSFYNGKTSWSSDTKLPLSWDYAKLAEVENGI